MFHVQCSFECAFLWVGNLYRSLNLISPVQRCTDVACLCTASIETGLQSCVNCALTGNPSQDTIQTAQSLVNCTIHPSCHTSMLNYFSLYSVSEYMQWVWPELSYLPRWHPSVHPKHPKHPSASRGPHNNRRACNHSH